MILLDLLTIGVLWWVLMEQDSLKLSEMQAGLIIVEIAMLVMASISGLFV